MHVSLETKDLLRALELVGKISTKHITLPVLECLYLEAKGKELCIRATNLEVGIEVTIPAEVSSGGTLAVPTPIFTQVAHLHVDEKTSFTTDGGSLIFKGKGSDTTIKTLPHEEFPSIPKLKGNGQTLNGSLFALGLRSVAFAASQSSIKPELGSVYIYQKKEQSLTFVATDSFRLMEKTVPQKGVVFDSSVLLPHKNAHELARITDLEGSDPVYRSDGGQFSLEFPSGTYVTSRLTSGSFPDYEQIIPKEYVFEATVFKHDLLHAFKKSAIFLNKFFQVKLALAHDELVVSADNGDVGTTSETIKAKTEGGELALNFNQRYIVEALGHFVDENIALHFAGIGRPMVIKGVGDASVRYLVMPMNK